MTDLARGDMGPTGWAILVVAASVGTAGAEFLLPGAIATVVEFVYALFFFSVISNVIVGTPLIGLSSPGIVATLGPPISVAEVLLGGFILLAALGAVVEES